MLTDACPALFDAQAFGRSASNSLLGQLTFCQPPFRFQEPSCLFARELRLVSKSRVPVKPPGARRAERVRAMTLPQTGSCHLLVEIQE
jgi:hypothetical protein